MWRLPTEPTAATQASLLPPPEQWAAWCAAHAGTRPWLWVPAERLHLVTLDPQLPLTAQELPPHARGVFAHYLGDIATQAPLAVWRAGVHRGACLLAGVALQDMLDTAAAQRVQLRGLWPLWAGQLSQAWADCTALRQARSAVLLVVEGTLLTAITLRASRVQAVQLHRLDSASPAALADWLATEPEQGPVWAIGHGLQGPAAGRTSWQAVGPLDASAPMLRQAAPGGPMAQWPDFLSPQHHARLRRQGWAVAAGAWVLLAAASLHAGQAWQALEAARALPSPTALARARTQPLSGPALPGLQHEWPALLADVEQLGARHQVRWLALEHQPARGQVRLQGQAASAELATDLAAAMSARPAWREVLLDRLDPQGSASVAFEISARRSTFPQGAVP